MAVIFVHGVPETAAIWDPLLAGLGRDDAITLSPPGFGAPVPAGVGCDGRGVPVLAGRGAGWTSTRRHTPGGHRTQVGTCVPWPRGV